MSEFLSLPSLKEYSCQYQLISASQAKTFRSSLGKYKLYEGWDAPVIDQNGALHLHGLEFKPAAQAKIKVFMGNDAYEAAIWADDPPRKLLGISFDCRTRIRFAEECLGEDPPRMEEVEKYLSDKFGRLMLSYSGVWLQMKATVPEEDVQAITDPEIEVILRDPAREPLSLAGSGADRFLPDEEDKILKAIAIAASQAAPRRVFIAANWQLRNKDDQILTPVKEVFMEVKKDLSFTLYGGKEDLIAAAKAALSPAVQEMWQVAKKLAVGSRSIYTRSFHGDEPWEETSGYYKYGGYASVRSYLRKGNPWRKTISADAMTPWWR